MEQDVIDQTLERIRLALENGKVDEAITALITLHPADQAEAYADLPPDDQAEMLPRLDAEETADLFEHLEDDDVAQAVPQLSSDRLADVLGEMQPDDAADVLGDLPPEQAATVIAQMDAEQAEDVLPLLAYKDDTAGGLMTPDYPYLHLQMTCQAAIDLLRAIHLNGDTPYYLYVLDADDRLIGNAASPSARLNLKMPGAHSLAKPASESFMDSSSAHWSPSVTICGKGFRFWV